MPPNVHPLLQQDGLVLKTRQMIKTEERILQWLWTNSTGGYIAGDARMGKSTAIIDLQHRLRLRTGQPVPHHLVVIPRRDKPTINALLRCLCASVNIRITNTSKSDVMESDFITYLVDQVMAQETDRFVLFVDEMQRLTPTQLDVFAMLYDRLRLLKISLMTVFIGNLGAIQKLLAFVNADENEYLRGRFFCFYEKFEGLTSLADVKFCLAQYDQRVYPPDSTTTYTRYFLPNAPKNWKLTSLAPRLWQTFREYQTTYRIPSWGMQYFRTVVDLLLLDYLPRFGVEQVDESLVNEVFQLSGLLASQVTGAS